MWVGNFDRKPLRQSTGVTGAAPIFHAVMLAAEKRFGGRTEALVDVDDMLVEEEICSLSGTLANEWCPSTQREWLAADGVESSCSWHHVSDEGLLVVWPPQYRQWAKQSGRLTDAWRYADKAFAARTAGTGTSGPPAPRVALQITNPPAGAVYLIDPTLRREFQTLPLRVVASRPGRIEWSINGQPAGVSSSDATLMWPLTPGSHRIAARDDEGRSTETTVVVR